jgi:hypothetical protein
LKRLLHAAHLRLVISTSRDDGEDCPTDHWSNGHIILILRQERLENLAGAGLPEETAVEGVARRDGDKGCATIGNLFNRQSVRQQHSKSEITSYTTSG